MAFPLLCGEVLMKAHIKNTTLREKAFEAYLESFPVGQGISVNAASMFVFFVHILSKLYSEPLKSLS